jgi:diguanylate cyclase (GGDEF)-like protein
MRSGTFADNQRVTVSTLLLRARALNPGRSAVVRPIRAANDPPIWGMMTVAATVTVACALVLATLFSHDDPVRPFVAIGLGLIVAAASAITIELPTGVLFSPSDVFAAVFVASVPVGDLHVFVGAAVLASLATQTQSWYRAVSWAKSTATVLLGALVGLAIAGSAGWNHVADPVLVSLAVLAGLRLFDATLPLPFIWWAQGELGRRRHPTFSDFARSHIVSQHMFITMAVLELPMVVLGVLVWPRAAWATLLLVTPFALLWMVLRAQERLRSAELQLRTDALTGVLARQFILDQLAVIAINHRGSSAGVAIAVVDLDNFKRCNDTLGHAVGDSVLVDAARSLVTVAHPAGGQVGRYGGEEFLVIFDDVGPARLAELAEQLRAAVESSVGVWEVTASIGTATLQPGEGLIDLFDRADTAMYRAKSLGKNQVHHATASRSDDALAA